LSIRPWHLSSRFDQRNQLKRGYLLIQFLSQAITSEILQAKVGPQHLPLLPIGSNSREAVEETRTKMLAVIKRRWLQMRPVGAFDQIEDWSLREISEGQALVCG
jgi:hypothetical protein